MYDKTPYQSSLWIISHSADEIIYSEGENLPAIARIYEKEGEWFLATAYLQHWQPVPAVSKYEAFLLLLNLKKRQ